METDKPGTADDYGNIYNAGNVISIVIRLFIITRLFMKISRLIPFATLCIICAGCSDKESDGPYPDPAPQSDPGISGITGDRYEMEISRRPDGRISSTIVNDAGDKWDCRYEYPSDDMIDISSTVSDRTYKETVHLHEGLFSYCEGEWWQIEHGTPHGPIYYRIDFRYDADGYLQTIKWTQTYPNPSISAWEWTDHVIWKDGNPERLEKSHGHSTPVAISEFSYTDIPARRHSLGLMLTLEHHLPLHFDGLLGRLPANYPDRVTFRNINIGHDDLLLRYSYRMESGMLDGYSTTYYSVDGQPGRKRDYTIHWAE